MEFDHVLFPKSPSPVSKIAIASLPSGRFNFALTGSLRLKDYVLGYVFVPHAGDLSIWGVLRGHRILGVGTVNDWPSRGAATMET